VPRATRSERHAEGAHRGSLLPSFPPPDNLRKWPLLTSEEPVAQFGPFVMNTPYEIEPAPRDFQSAAFQRAH